MTTILVTRPEPDLGHSTVRLRALNLDAVKLPLMRRVTLFHDLPPAEGFGGIAISSANALRALDERGAVRAYENLPVFAVGDGSAREAQFLGFTDVRSANGSFEDLVTLIAESRPTAPIFYPSGSRLSGDLNAALGAHGVGVTRVPVYEMEEAEEVPSAIIEQIRDGLIDAGLFYSRRTAAIFADLTRAALGERGLEDFGALCISRKAAEPLVEAGFKRVLVAERPDEEGMMVLALAFARAQNAS
ncbi:uroporphyrinogen-III synthase [Paradevosia shaoguanensis]|uniref:uroporphyrinogen-III synthase n=1 Tax=Paradevosia shaoguanensis TaxID=1335043 RepID=UPI003C778391